MKQNFIAKSITKKMYETSCKRWRIWRDGQHPPKSQHHDKWL